MFLQDDDTLRLFLFMRMTDSSMKCLLGDIDRFVQESEMR